jgi:hypothetical protein
MAPNLEFRFPMTPLYSANMSGRTKAEFSSKLAKHRAIV